MVLRFPRRRHKVPVTRELVERVAATERLLDKMLEALYAELPTEPSGYPIRIGEFLIHYRRRPRSVVTPAGSSQVG